MSMYDDLPEIQHGIEGMFAGKIASKPANVNAPVMVTIPAWDDHIKIGPCAWVTKGSSLPKRGQNCMVIFDNNQQAVVTAWWDGTGGQGSSIGSSPPANPVDGNQWIHTPTYWQFVYDSTETTYKWKFIGGPPMSHEINTAEANANGAYGDLATVGPTITLPRAGDYEVSFGCMIVAPLNFAEGASAAIKRGAAATSDNDLIQFFNPANAANQSVSEARQIRITDMAASAVVKMQYKVIISAATVFGYRWMKVTPVRVI